MTEISYLELQKDTEYYVLLEGETVPPTEHIVEFKSYNLVDDLVNFYVYYLDLTRKGSIRFEDFENKKANIFTITEDEKNIMSIK
tara:strand:- start:9076 stop:9330 length:255 start_codon:yes stop_codon:yes gene_type:complete